MGTNAHDPTLDWGHLSRTQIARQHNVASRNVYVTADSDFSDLRQRAGRRPAPIHSSCIAPHPQADVALKRLRLVDKTSAVSSTLNCDSRTLLFLNWQMNFSSLHFDTSSKMVAISKGRNAWCCVRSNWNLFLSATRMVVVDVLGTMEMFASICISTVKYSLLCSLLIFKTVVYFFHFWNGWFSNHFFPPFKVYL